MVPVDLEVSSTFCAAHALGIGRIKLLSGATLWTDGIDQPKVDLTHTLQPTLSVLPLHHTPFCGVRVAQVHVGARHRHVVPTHVQDHETRERIVHHEKPRTAPQSVSSRVLDTCPFLRLHHINLGNASSLARQSRVGIHG